MSYDVSGQKYRRQHDPYNDMEEPDIRPKNIARQELSDAEKAASSTDQPKDSKKSLASRERNMASDFRNAVHGRRERQSRRAARSERGGRGTRSSNKSFKVKNKGRFSKRLAPVSLITGLLVGGGALFYMSQSILGPHLSSLFTEATDVQFSSYHARNQRLFKYMLDGGDQIKVGFFKKKYATFTPYLKSRLKKNGIEVGRLDADGTFHSNQLISTSKTVLKYNDEIIDANSFQNKFASDANFREAYYRAKRGRVAGFFDDSADYFYKKKGVTRDIFDKFKSTGDADADTENYRKIVSDRVTNTDADINTVKRTVDEDGKETVSSNGDNVETKKISGSTPEAKARSLVNNIAGKVSNVGVPVCTALRIANIAAVSVTAYQIFASIAYFHSLMEPTSKMMAGEGDTSGINETLNFFTTETTSQVQYTNDDGTTTTKNVTGSPLQSAGAKLILGDTLTPKKDVAPYSFKDIMRSASTVALATGASQVVCDGVQAASAIMSLASNFVPGGALANFVIRAVAYTVGGIAITGIVAGIINTLIPRVAKMFASNIWEAYTGIPAGELFAQGAATSNFKLAQQSSAYMPASEEYIKRQNHETTVALAEEAAIDRNGRSPFDITSRHTFLGSLLSKFAFLSYEKSSLGIFANLAKTVSNSLSIFNPTSSAYDSSISYTSNYSACENALDDTTCDMYDQEIMGMDYSTIDLSPNDPTYAAVIEPNLDENGKIKGKSELAKFINVCTNRESPWGVLDANIMNSLQTDLGVVGNNIYLVNDVVDIINAAEDVANRDWGTGENCKMSKDNPRWDSEFKYYQRYIEDMRILDGMDGDDEDSPVLAYMKNYDEEHPIDTSFTGTLARISGQSKDDVAFLLEYINYSNKIANYDPSTRYSFVGTTEPETISFTEETIQPFNIITISQADLFTDRRNYTV